MFSTHSFHYIIEQFWDQHNFTQDWQC